MRTLYLDCGAGISGNMFLGSMIDLGFPKELLEKELKKLPVAIPEIQVTTVTRKGLSAIFFEVDCGHEHHHRHLAEIIRIIEDARFDVKVTDNAVKCFTLLAEAEAKIHGVSVEEIHFHEVGAIDAIVDIVGAFLALAYFEVEEVKVSPIRVGYGTVRCAHGEIPIPAPATAQLLNGFTIYGGEYQGEWATPTGSALLKTIAIPCVSFPMMKIHKTGYGAGTADRSIPNVLRSMLGDTGETQNTDEMQTVIETNIDDMNPECYGFLGDLLLAAGAKDYFYTGIQMKKGRPGVLITVVAPSEKEAEIEEILLRETTTLGIRKHQVQRRCMERNHTKVEIDGNLIRVKLAGIDGKVMKYAPEYEDCLQAAKNLKRPVIDIYQEANFKARKVLQDEGAI